ncbi:hypothetical protein BDR06DRAFT_1008156 [Suillus hirtellus]|nr:hypothetical protein BDR06DRAFT_1008156 [Suillus hirtellus]
MAPKKAKGGGKKGGSGGDEGGSHLLLNQHPIEPAPPEIDLGKETQKLDSWVAKCKVGITWVNLLEIGDMLKFSVYNNCPENDVETSKLVIPIIINLKHVANKDSLLQTFDELEKMGELKLKDQNPIVVVSGQHHLSVLRQYARSVQDEYDSLEKKWMKIIGMPKPSADHVQQHNQYWVMQEDLQWILDNISQWGVIVYDQEAMDKHAKDAFGEITDTIGDMSPKYIMHLSSYWLKVIKTLRDRWNLTLHTNFKDNQILTHLDCVIARVMLHLTPQEGKKQAPDPLLGGFMMLYDWASFMKIERGITEVCRWFETLLNYYWMLHPKTHMMDDWSSMMMANIGKDPHFIEHGHNNPREGNNRTLAAPGDNKHLEEEPAPKKKKKKGKRQAVQIKTPPVLEQDTEPDDVPACPESAPPHNVDNNDAGSHTPIPGSQQSDLPAMSKPSKTLSDKPKPHPIVNDSLSSGGHDARTNDDDAVTPHPPIHPLTEDSVSLDRPSGTIETDQGPAQATIPSVAVSTGIPGMSAQGTVASVGDTLFVSETHDNDDGGILTGTISPLTPSPDGLSHGFGTGDTSWYDPNDDDNKDHEMQDRYSTSKEYVEDEDTHSTSHASDVDDPHDKTYMPTQPLTQDHLPSHNKEPRIVAAGPTKCVHAEIGASLSLSTHGRGRQTKKKPKVNVQSSDEEDNETIVLGI